MAQNQPPLCREKGETTKANKALRDYAQMGVSRSLHKLLQTYIKSGMLNTPTTCLRTLANWSVKYRWQERCQTFDDLERQKEARAFEQAQWDWRQKRLDMTKVIYGKLGVAVNAYKPQAETLSQLAHVLRIVNDELRLAFGEQVQQVEVTVQGDLGGIDYDQLTVEELQTLVAAATVFAPETVDE